MTDTDWITDLARLAEAAQELTPGEWVAGDGWVYTPPVYDDDNRLASVLGMKYADRDRANAEHARAQRNAEFIAAANPATILRLIEDLRRTKSGARTLGRIIEQQNRDALDASGMHHVVDETGDGDWEVVWEALALLRPERDELAAKVAAVEALADEWERSGGTYPAAWTYLLDAAERLRAVLSAAPTDTTKEN